MLEVWPEGVNDILKGGLRRGTHRAIPGGAASQPVIAKSFELAHACGTAPPSGRQSLNRYYPIAWRIRAAVPAHDVRLASRPRMTQVRRSKTTTAASGIEAGVSNQRLDQSALDRDSCKRSDDRCENLVRFSSAGPATARQSHCSRVRGRHAHQSPHRRSARESQRPRGVGNLPTVELPTVGRLEQDIPDPRCHPAPPSPTWKCGAAVTVPRARKSDRAVSICSHS